jgi:hypothetical protein
MKIQTSLDWLNVCSNLHTQLDSLPYNPDLYKMSKNIEKMIDDLSKLEVEARRIRNTSILQEKISKINQAIDHLEKLLIIAQLMR